MIWSFLKKNRLITGGLLAICCLFSVFLLSSKTYADTYTYTWDPQTFDLYNYIRDSAQHQVQQTYNYVDDASLPFVFMSVNGTPPSRSVYGMHMTDFKLPNQNYYYYNRFEGHIIISATSWVQLTYPTNNNAFDTFYVNLVHTDGTFKQYNCPINMSTFWSSAQANLQFDCVGEWESGKTPAYIDFQWGNLNYNSVVTDWVPNGRNLVGNYGYDNNADNGSHLATTIMLQGYGFKVITTSSAEQDYYDGVNSRLDNINDSINNLDVNSNYERQQDQADRNNVQNTSDNATQAGNNATTNANNATSSILGAITGIYGQLLHPSTSDCIISGVQVYQLNLGNLDFCTGFDIPQPIFAVGGLIMIGLIILLSWSILKAGMGLYNDLLGGK